MVAIIVYMNLLVDVLEITVQYLGNVDLLSLQLSSVPVGSLAWHEASSIHTIVLAEFGIVTKR